MSSPASSATDSGLSYPDYVVLVALTDRPDGRMRLFELADVLGWEKSRLSHHVARMADRGLVKKEKCDSDRRGAFVVVTKQGRKEIEAAAPGHVAAVRRLFIDRLTPAQLDTIVDAAGKALAGPDADQMSEFLYPVSRSAVRVDAHDELADCRGRLHVGVGLRRSRRAA